MFNKTRPNLNAAFKRPEATTSALHNLVPHTHVEMLPLESFFTGGARVPGLPISRTKTET